MPDDAKAPSATDAMMSLMKLPTSTGRDGIHICAQLRMDGMQIERVAGWATRTMERAAQHIEVLEKMIVELKTGKKETTDGEAEEASAE